MSEIKWGFIGCGKVVEKKSGPAFNTANNSSIYAVMRRNLENAKNSAKKLGAKKWYDNIEDLLNDDNVNAVYIATPPGLHLEQAIKCCQARKATYIEKTFARNYKEALEIVEMFEKSDTPLYIAHYRRAMPKFIKIKHLLDEGIIGKICEVDFRLNRKYNKDEILNSWLYDTELSGGGKFYDIAPHSIDIMVYLFGNFTKINGIASNNNKEYKVEDVVVMSFETEKGIIGTANFNSIALDKKDKMSIYGTKGTMEFSIHGEDDIIIKCETGEEHLHFINPTIIQESMVHEVVDSIITGKHLNTCYGREALETYRIIDNVLNDYYHGRENEFWKRENTWN